MGQWSDQVYCGPTGLQHAIDDGQRCFPLGLRPLKKENRNRYYEILLGCHCSNLWTKKVQALPVNAAQIRNLPRMWGARPKSRDKFVSFRWVGTSHVQQCKVYALNLHRQSWTT